MAAASTVTDLESTFLSFQINWEIITPEKIKLLENGDNSQRIKTYIVNEITDQLRNI